jgi:hypothetical protein
VAVLVGVATGVGAQHADHGIGGWEELGIVVLGSIVAAVALAIAKWLWDRWNDPRLIIQCGNGGYFDMGILETEELVQRYARGQQVEAAWVKLLAVRETHGRHAREVTVSVVDVDCPGEVYELPQTLKWLDTSEVTDIGAKNHKRFILQLLISTMDQGGQRQYATLSPIDSSTPQTITIEVRVSGRHNRTMRFPSRRPVARSTRPVWPRYIARHFPVSGNHRTC